MIPWMPLAMGRCSSDGHGPRRILNFGHEGTSTSAWLLLAVLLLLSWPADVLAMRPDRIAKLRQETVEMFYHGYDNYMKIAFPEDEVRYTSLPFQPEPSRDDMSNISTTCSYDQYHVPP